MDDSYPLKQQLSYLIEKPENISQAILELKKLVPNLIALKEFISEYFKDVTQVNNLTEKPKTLGLENTSA